MFELFSDIFARRDNVLTRMDPRVKLGVTASLILTVLLAHHIAWPLLIFALCFAAILLIRIPAPLFLTRLLIPMSTVAVIVLLKTFMTKETPLAVFPLLGLKFVAYREGLAQGALIGSRVLGAVSAIMLLGFATPTHEIFRALRGLGAPAELVEIAMLMYRNIFVLIEQAEEVAVAQRVRLGYTGFFRSVSSAGTLVGSVLIRSLDQVSHTHEAMTARCYNGSIPFSPLGQMRGIHWAVMIACWLLIAGLFTIFEGALP